MDDVRAVMDAVGSQRAAFYGLSEGAAMSILFAATYPERTAALVVRSAFPAADVGARLPLGSHGRRIRARGRARRWRSFGPREQARSPCASSAVHRRGGGRVSRDDPLRLEPGRARGAPSHEQGDRHPARPAGGARPDADVARLRGQVVPAEVAHYMASAFRRRGSSRSRESGHLAFGERPERDRLRDRGASSRMSGRPAAGRRPSRIACSRPCSSPTSSARRRRRPSSATAPGASCSSATTRSSAASSSASAARELDTAGDGFFARFDGPARAIRCACAIVDGVRELGLEVRAGLHTGECELMDGKVGGYRRPHRRARRRTRRGPGRSSSRARSRTSSPARGFASQTGEFASSKGIPGDWHLFAVEEI